MGLTGYLEQFLRSQTVRKFYAAIPADHVTEPAVEPATFAPDEAYLTLTLSEMYLRDKREYWKGFVPMCLVVTELTYRDTCEVIPFFVGDRLLGSIEAALKGQQVEYLNTRVAGPLPYKEGNINLFVGLFRTQVSDLVQTLLGFVEQIAGALNTGALSPYLTVARVVANGLPSLLHPQNMEFRFGTRDEFSGGNQGTNVLRQGYLVYANCSDQALDVNHFWVRKGRLYISDTAAQGKRYRGSDFCMLRIDHLTERDDYRTLPFYACWQKAQRTVWEGQIERARKELLPQTTRAIALSPDLTRHDKYHLLQAFKLDFEREVDMYFGTTGGERPDVTRGPDEQLNARKKIQKAAVVSADISRQAQLALLAIADKWESIPDLKREAGKAEVTDAELKQQLQTLKGVAPVKEPDPDSLAEALVADAISFQSR